MGAEQFAPMPMPALRNFADFGAATNATLSAPDRRDVADRKAAAIPAWSVGYCNRLGR